MSTDTGVPFSSKQKLLFYTHHSVSIMQNHYYYSQLFTAY